MRKLPELMGDAAAMKNFGDTVVVWDFHARKPLQTLKVPVAPLEIRWAWAPSHEYAFIEAALTGELWGVFRKSDGTFEAVKVADIGPRDAQPLLAVDISISANDKYLFVDTFMDGKVRVFDITNPRKPTVIYERVIGKQVNMVSQTWDGKRVYFTSSLLANWDGTGHEDEQFLRAFGWDGKQLTAKFEVDFRKAKLGRPHHMQFGQEGFWASRATPDQFGVAQR
jgi:selenium-binding protein 1